MERVEHVSSRSFGHGGHGGGTHRGGACHRGSGDAFPYLRALPHRHSRPSPARIAEADGVGAAAAQRSRRRGHELAVGVRHELFDGVYPWKMAEEEIINVEDLGETERSSRHRQCACWI